MAAHRYWRIQSIEANGASYAGNTTIGEIQLRDAGGTNRIGSGTASASSNFGTSYAASYAVDGNPATEWCNAAGAEGSNGWWQYDFGAGNAWDIASIVITSSTYSADYNYTPTQIAPLYSDDGTHWYDACAALTVPNWTGGNVSQTFTVGAAIDGTSTWNTSDTHWISLSNTNTTATAFTVQAGARASLKNSGKLYFEGTLTTAAASDTGFGIANAVATFGPLASNAANGLIWYHGFAPYFNGSPASGLSGLGTLAQGNTVCVAIDLGNTLIWLRVGATGNWNGSGTADPASGTGGFNYGAIGATVAPTCCLYNTSDANTINLGGTAFIGAVPSGFASWRSGPVPPTNTSWDPNDLLAVTLGGGNLTATATSTSCWVKTVDAQTSGKYYFEIQATTWVNSSTQFGICNVGGGPTTANLNAAVINSGAIYIANTNTGSTLGTRAANDIIGVAVDLGANNIWFRVAPSGNWNGSGTANPATNTGGLSISMMVTSGINPVAIMFASGDACVANFGNSAFSGVVPSGFTAGFPAQTITHATWSQTDKTSNASLSSASQTASLFGASAAGFRATSPKTVGKAYFEVLCTNWTASTADVGVANTSVALTAINSPAAGTAVVIQSTGNIWINGNNSLVTFGARSNGDVIGVAVDLSSQLIWFRVAPSGNWNANASYAPGGAGGLSIASIMTAPVAPAVGSANPGGNVFTGSFGDGAFVGAVPSGFAPGWPPPTYAELTQVAVEQWAQGTPQAQLTQVAVEEWASVAVAPLTGRAYALTASRAGIPSAVLWQTTTRTFAVSHSAIVAEAPTSAPLPPPVGGAQSRVMVMA